MSAAQKARLIGLGFIAVVGLLFLLAPAVLEFAATLLWWIVALLIAGFVLAG